MPSLGKLSFFRTIMQFIDVAEIHVRGGHGGDGAASFRRERRVPRGGPSGGDGGRGGSVWAVADEGINTLIDFHYEKRFFAGNGEGGRSRDAYGAKGKDLWLRLPVGTVVTDIETNEAVADLVHAGQTVLLAKGGAGGLGNLHFKSSTNRAPRMFTPGVPGEDRRLRLELRLIAEAGLLGLPNAGKSSLLCRVSAARPKVADYPFTTKEPHLGTVRLGFERSFVIADIPGIIEGAAQGSGMGLFFLRHLLRCRVLLHLVAVRDDGTLSIEDARLVENEVRTYRSSLAAKPRIVVVNKIDLLPQDARQALLDEFSQKLGQDVLAISCATGEGLDALLQILARTLAPAPAEAHGA